METEDGLLVIEIKGIGGTSTDGQCSQIEKIKNRRMQERRNFDVFGLYIVNHQRYQPPLLRENPPFKREQIQDAENDKRGLLTTWQLFNLYFSIKNGCISKEEARKALLKYGLIEFSPQNCVSLGEPVKILHAIDPTGKFVTTGSNGDFNYTIGEVGKEQGLATNYSYSQERWNFKGWATNESNMTVGTPYNFDVTGIVKVPGYIPMAYWGLENIGFNDQYDQNPSTMYGLSYYYVAPEMEMNGTVILDDGVVHGMANKVIWVRSQNLYSTFQPAVVISKIANVRVASQILLHYTSVSDFGLVLFRELFIL